MQSPSSVDAAVSTPPRAPGVLVARAQRLPGAVAQHDLTRDELLAALASVGGLGGADGAEWAPEVAELRPGVFRCVFARHEDADVASRAMHMRHELPGGARLVLHPMQSDGRPARNKDVQAAVEARREGATARFKPAAEWRGAHAEVEGLVLVEELVSEAEEQVLLGQLLECHAAWEAGEGEQYRRQPRQRRVQHFGHRFDYVARRCDASLGALPGWLVEVADRVSNAVQRALGAEWRADQATANEYLPGQGIAPHVDTHSAFADGIASLSLGAGCVMRFAPCGDKARAVDAWLPRRSLLIMTRAARYHFTHGIPQRKSDLLDDGEVRPRGTRVSLTFRQVLAAPSCPDCPSPGMCDLQQAAEAEAAEKAGRSSSRSSCSERQCAAR